MVLVKAFRSYSVIQTFLFYKKGNVILIELARQLFSSSYFNPYCQSISLCQSLCSVLVLTPLDDLKFIVSDQI